MALVVVAALGCSKQGSGGPADEIEPCHGLPSNDDTEFRSIEFFEGWGPCYNRNKCWRRMGVSYDGTLVLADSDGTEVFTITEEELEPLRDLSESRETWDFIAVGSCKGYGEGMMAVVDLRLKNGTSMGHDQADGCTVLKVPEDPIGHLYRAVEALGKKYFPCPAGYEYSIDDAHFYVLSDDARALCAWRYDK